MNEKKPSPNDGVLMYEDLQLLAEALAPLAPPAYLRERVLRQARAPAHLTELYSVRADEGDWQRIIPGVEMKMLFADSATGAESFLLRLAPGASLPPHHHAAHEECMVLQGEIAVGQTTLTTGDYHLAPRGVAHDTIVSRTGALLFLRRAASGDAAGHR